MTLPAPLSTMCTVFKCVECAQRIIDNIRDRQHATRNCYKQKDQPKQQTSGAAPIHVVGTLGGGGVKGEDTK